MQRRTLLAVSTLTALLLSIVVLQTAPTGAAEFAAHAQAASDAPLSVEAPAAPQWAYAWGMEGEDAAAFGAAGVFTCAWFIWVGAIACGLTGVA